MMTAYGLTGKTEAWETWIPDKNNPTSLTLHVLKEGEWHPTVWARIAPNAPRVKATTFESGRYLVEYE